MHRLFYSTTFSAAEREAGFVIDGLMHNHVVQSDIHSTDTHGYSELIFALTHLLGIEFAPRIKEFVEQNFYRMEGVEVSPLEKYSLKIGPEIDTGLIKEQWYTLPYCEWQPVLSSNTLPLRYSYAGLILIRISIRYTWLCGN